MRLAFRCPVPPGRPWGRNAPALGDARRSFFWGERSYSSPKVTRDVEEHMICGTAVHCLSESVSQIARSPVLQAWPTGYSHSRQAPARPRQTHALLARIRYNVNIALQYRVSVSAAKSRLPDNHSGERLSRAAREQWNAPHPTVRLPSAAVAAQQATGRCCCDAGTHLYNAVSPSVYFLSPCDSQSRLRAWVIFGPCSVAGGSTT